MTKDTAMFAVGLRLTHLLAVLVQYAQVRYCALEQLVFGSNCHDRGVHLVIEASDRACAAEQSSRCLCDRPVVTAQQPPQSQKSNLDCASPIVALMQAIIPTVSAEPFLFPSRLSSTAPPARILPLLN